MTGNSSWWKARKYRREAAKVLLGYRADGWKLMSHTKESPSGPDTRIFTKYVLVRTVAKRAVLHGIIN